MGPEFEPRGTRFCTMERLCVVPEKRIKKAPGIDRELGGKALET